MEVISTHAPRTGSDGFRVEFTHAEQLISTHAPRTGSDPLTVIVAASSMEFQPTLPARGATHHNWEE